MPTTEVFCAEGLLSQATANVTDVHRYVDGLVSESRSVGKRLRLAGGDAAARARHGDVEAQLAEMRALAVSAHHAMAHAAERMRLFAPVLLRHQIAAYGLLADATADSNALTPLGALLAAGGDVTALVVHFGLLDARSAARFARVCRSARAAVARARDKSPQLVGALRRISATGSSWCLSHAFVSLRAPLLAVSAATDWHCEAPRLMPSTTRADAPALLSVGPSGVTHLLRVDGRGAASSRVVPACPSLCTLAAATRAAGNRYTEATNGASTPLLVGRLTPPTVGYLTSPTVGRADRVVIAERAPVLQTVDDCPPSVTPGAPLPDVLQAALLAHPDDCGVLLRRGKALLLLEPSRALALHADGRTLVAPAPLPPLRPAFTHWDACQPWLRASDPAAFAHPIAPSFGARAGPPRAAGLLPLSASRVLHYDAGHSSSKIIARASGWPAPALLSVLRLVGLTTGTAGVSPSHALGQMLSEMGPPYSDAPLDTLELRVDLGLQSTHLALISGAPLDPGLPRAPAGWRLSAPRSNCRAETLDARVLRAVIRVLTAALTTAPLSADCVVVLLDTGPGELTTHHVPLRRARTCSMKDLLHAARALPPAGWRLCAAQRAHSSTAGLRAPDTLQQRDLVDMLFQTQDVSPWSQTALNTVNTRHAAAAAELGALAETTNLHHPDKRVAAPVVMLRATPWQPRLVRCLPPSDRGLAAQIELLSNLQTGGIMRATALDSRGSVALTVCSNDTAGSRCSVFHLSVPAHPGSDASLAPLASTPADFARDLYDTYTALAPAGRAERDGPRSHGKT
jgi:hypothetical protein